MALTETKINNSIAVVRSWNVEVEEHIIIKKDCKEISRSTNRKVFPPGTLKGGDGDDKHDFVPWDVSAEDAEVQAICNTAWTDQVKADYRTHLMTSTSEAE